ncbi:MAG: DUF5982 domain-containing protein, partial [Leptospira sp.]|nr:DUF5982 domain-containing protein [Leptospira sp.]
MRIRNSLLVFFCAFSIVFLATEVSAQAKAAPQATPDDTAKKESADVRAPNTNLPFPIEEKKRISVKDAEKKKEGWYPTGLPLVNSDPNTGVGFGARVLLFNNGNKSDPFFEYTPYRTRIFAQYFNTTKNYQYHWLSLDAPYVFNTKWRVRSDAIYESNPVALFFGLGAQSLNTLSYRPFNDPNQPLKTNTRFGDTEDALGYARPANPNEIQYNENAQLNSFISQNAPVRAQQVTDKKYYRYDNKTPQFSTSAEHSFFGGTVRTVGGVRFAKNIINFFDGEIYNARGIFPYNTAVSEGTFPVVQGKTKLKQDCENKKIRGCDGGFVN